MTNVDLYSILLALVGMGFAYWGKRRTFIRLNQGRLEDSPSYGRTVIAKLTDSGLIAMGYGFIGGAFVILLVEYAFGLIMLGFILYVAFKLDDEWYERRR